MKTVGDRILIKPIQEKDESVFQTIESKRRPQKGEVVSAGNDCKVVKEGDKVLYALHAGLETELDGVRYIFMREGDIFAIL